MLVLVEEVGGPPPMKKCQRCLNFPASPGRKYCHVCEGKVVQEMKDTGYLTDPKRVPMVSERRGRKELSMRVTGGTTEMRDNEDE